MITGAHSILYSKDPEADRAFLRDVLGLPHVDAGHGWLIFGLPPAEVAVHPARKSGLQEFYLMCDDVRAFVRRVKAHGIACAPVQDAGWGKLTRLTLPGGGELGAYEPRHARPKSMRPRSAAEEKKGNARTKTSASAGAARKKRSGKARASREPR